jgi:hypothetical protein
MGWLSTSPRQRRRRRAKPDFDNHADGGYPAPDRATCRARAERHSRIHSLSLAGYEAGLGLGGSTWSCWRWRLMRIAVGGRVSSLAQMRRARAAQVSSAPTATEPTDAGQPLRLRRRQRPFAR